MTILNLQVSAGADDGSWRENDTAFLDSITVVDFGGMFFTTTGPYNGFARFTSVTVPAEASIDAARVTMRSSGGPYSNTVVNRRWCAIAADNAAAPTTYSAAESATRTTAFVNESNVPSWASNTDYQSPNLSAIIQEIVDRGGWATGNAIVIYGEDNGSTAAASVMRRAHSYEGNTSFAPKLTIEYTTNNTPPTITVNPTVNYNGYTRLGPNNTPGSVGFTATDPEETGSNALSYQIRTASGAGGTLVASGNFTSGTPASVNIAHNASGINEGSNTLYLRVYDGTDFAPTNPSFTLLVDRTDPTVGDIDVYPAVVTGGE